MLVSFEDCEKTSLELQRCFLKLLFLWISSFVDWPSNLFFILLGVFSCIRPVYLGCAPCTFNELAFLIK
jgi:hypothetical protein